MLNGYTYAYKSKRHYYCSKILVGCKARIKLDNSLKIIDVDEKHNHVRYGVSADGT